jgi:hypothetical protein
VTLELVDRTLDDVALLVALRVEPGWSTAAAATAQSVIPLISRLRDGRGDPGRRRWERIARLE